MELNQPSVSKSKYPARPTGPARPILGPPLHLPSNHWPLILSSLTGPSAVPPACQHTPTSGPWPLLFPPPDTRVLPSLRSFGLLFKRHLLR